ncbi:hypothetical protein CASFOL_027588 [Castilleja foliolosa]|uniref:Uncharacterized protein n=1 Tax=Castilleja foliolosa TaxID=1961234 RepID=A0ABD3CG38_9LAMI
MVRKSISYGHMFMLLGFLSILLTVTKRTIPNICIPTEVANKMLPCGSVIESSQRRLYEEEEIDPCSYKGKYEALGSLGKQNSVTGLPKYPRMHRNAISVKCFFRQFFSSVAKTDYLTLRYGFITTHLSLGQLNSFNFQKYIKHSLDKDFRTVVSIRPLMWFLVVIFMLLDIHGWHSYFWISFVRLTIVLTVGTKLEVIVAKMALQLKKQKNVIIEAQVVELNDNNFWFGQPSFLLDLMHFILFLMEFGSDS